MGAIAITGAASGIGLATARRLYAAGHEVWCMDRDQERLASAVDDLPQRSRIHTLRVDVANQVEVESAFQQIRAGSVGRLDGLVNSAGIVVLGVFEDLAVEDWENAFRVNVIGSFLAIKAAVPLLRAADAGSIVNLASMAGKLPGVYSAPYNASKAAVISLTRTAAVALAPTIRVNAVCPGVVRTPMYERLDAGLTALGAPKILQSNPRAASSPLARQAEADEIASVVEFLLGSASSYMTGEDVNVTGGFVMH